jgi:uracil-DNA glycosylase
MDFPCERAVPGFGPTDAHFHVVGDNPAVHGGLDTGIPFTDRPWSSAFFEALLAAGLVEAADLSTNSVDPGRTFFSFLHACLPAGETPTYGEYDAMEPFFDAELRAITAHVLVPVGQRATEHVLRTYTARPWENRDLEALHGTEVRGSGWLVVPCLDPATWTEGDGEALVDGLGRLQGSDYRRTADLGRFLPDGQSHLVR